MGLRSVTFRLGRVQKKNFLSTVLVSAVMSFMILVLYGLFIEPYKIEVRHLAIKDSQLGKILDGMIAVHLSDMHVRKIGKRELAVLRILDDLEPDFIFLTGDFVSWEGDYDLALTFLSRLKARIGVWAVMGDYDYSYSRNSCLFCHEQGSGKRTKSHQVQFLRNSIRAVSLPTGTVWIGGIDHNSKQIFIPEKVPQGWNRKEPAIILSHNPLSFDQLDETHNALMLSGDTHGGQVPLPSWMWKILGYKKNAHYNQGFFEKGRKKMFVTRGIGTSHAPVRIGRRPEVVVLHFRGQ